MEVSTIILIIVAIILLYLVISYIIGDVNKLTDIQNGKKMSKIEAASLAKSTTNPNSSNFAYSIWFYVDDWNYLYGKPKVIYGRMGATSAANGGYMTGVSGTDPCPAVVFSPVENNVVISLGCYSGNSSTVHNCTISNVPIQKWVNLLISVYGRTLDVYLDGKLVKTCILPGIAKINTQSPIYVTPQGGFSGWTAKFQYWPNSLNPQQAWNVYTQGYGSGWISNIFGKYKVEVTITEDGNPIGKGRL